MGRILNMSRVFWKTVRVLKPDGNLGVTDWNLPPNPIRCALFIPAKCEATGFITPGRSRGGRDGGAKKPVPKSDHPKKFWEGARGNRFSKGFPRVIQIKPFDRRV